MKTSKPKVTVAGLSPGVLALNPNLSRPAAVPATVQPAATKPARAKEPNRTEREYELMLTRAFPDATIRWEAYILRLAHRATYTPDFSVLHPGGELEFHEVKGAYIFPKALVKLRIAAELFDHPFTLAQKLKSGWQITQIQGARKP